MMTTCFRRMSAPLCSNAVNVRCFVSARTTGVCYQYLEPASWQHRLTPVTRSAISGLWHFRLKGTDSRVACWSGILQQVRASWRTPGTVLSTHQAAHERSVAGFWSLLSPTSRRLFSGKTKETSDKSPEADRNEASPSPGHGLFKFKELEVEPMSKESDHIHIIALAQALNVSILVEYMDRGEGGTVNHHVFPEGGDPRIFLLYRPGHYDILYK